MVPNKAKAKLEDMSYLKKLMLCTWKLKSSYDHAACFLVAAGGDA
ncbi:hypothetical protein SLEP1_g29835 [Rubroshorea leprosula]|uniref:Uncharacterized protein n=1 Tax=Rubroshorea leprosula TaxID=152421 RepID=A0AAV5K7Y8_9ROSI|nr:hypothetical protein SLEP1_g29835 [Rubroshorea leprosula]